MGTVIIAMPRIEDAEKIGGLFRKRGMSPGAVCQSASDVLMAAGGFDNGVVICSGRINDMNPTELDGYLPDFYDMIVIGSGDVLEDLPSKIIRMTNPFKASDLVNTAVMLLEQQNRTIRKSKKIKNVRNFADQAKIDQAKKLLMERNDMTEPEAYRYLQKCSMDSATNIVETAEMVLLLGTG